MWALCSPHRYTFIRGHLKYFMCSYGHAVLKKNLFPKIFQVLIMTKHLFINQLLPTLESMKTNHFAISDKKISNIFDDDDCPWIL